MTFISTFRLFAIVSARLNRHRQPGHRNNEKSFHSDTNKIKYLPTRDSQQHSKVFHLWHKVFKTLSCYFIQLILESLWGATNLSALFFCASFGCTDFSEGWVFLAMAGQIKQSYWWNTKNSKDTAVYILLNQNQDRSLKNFYAISKYENKF